MPRLHLLPAVLVVCLPAWVGAQPASTAQLRLRVRDDNGKALPCRIHLTGPDGKPVRADKLPFWRDHFVCAGDADLDLAPGTYRYEVERGPEHEKLSGTVDVKETRELALKLRRVADLAARGWYSGDLHVHRPSADVPLLMRAEDLRVAPVITWWNNTNPWAKQELPKEPLVRFDGDRYYRLLGGEDERGGGALLYFNGPGPLPIAGSEREYPSPMKFVTAARKQKGWWIDIEKPFWWDVPAWLASGAVDSIGIAHNHMHRGGVYPGEAWGRPRVADRYPGPHGNGLWTQDIYYHALNGGLRLPPSAGSASGVLPNPVGYNRVYVHTGKAMSWEEWWRGLKAGRCFVTNGPLLLVEANGKRPGEVFTAAAGESVAVALNVSVTSNERLAAVELVRDGRVESTVAVKGSSWEGPLKLTFRKSGWFLVRVRADSDNTFRFASTAPWYVEVGAAKHPVRRESAKFFVEWLKERQGQLRERLKDPEKLREVLAPHEQALKFWEERLAQAED